MAAVDLAKLRAAILDWLRRAPGPDRFNLHQNEPLYQFLTGERGFSFAWPDVGPIRVVLHELAHEGILVPGSPGAKDGDAWALPSYFLSPHGRKVLDNRDYEPHDPHGYLARLAAEVPAADPVVTAYLVEAVKAYHHQLNLASAAMLGCAAEKAVLNLIDVLKSRITDAKARGRFAKDVDAAKWIKQKYDALMKHLPVAVPMPKDLAERVDFALDGAFRALRLARNDAGHPTRGTIERELVHGNLVMFPTCYKGIKALEAHIAAGATPPSP